MGREGFEYESFSEFVVNFLEYLRKKSFCFFYLIKWALNIPSVDILSIAWASELRAIVETGYFAGEGEQ